MNTHTHISMCIISMPTVRRKGPVTAERNCAMRKGT